MAKGLKDGIQMFGISGAGIGAIRMWANNGKPPRWSLDQWDKVWLEPNAGCWLETLLTARAQQSMV